MRDDNRPGYGHNSENPFGSARKRSNGANGVRPEGMRARPTPIDEYEDPIDLVAVQADDELINALAAGMSVSAPGLSGYDVDDQVAAVLAAWRNEVDSEPIPELVDLDTAVATVMAARPSSRRIRHLAPVAAAAAFVVLAIGGVSVGSYSSQPGDALWGVSKVLYSERAQSVEAAARVETRIDKAKQALVKGDPVVAAQELQQAATDLAAVRPEEGKDELVDVQDFLAAKAAETPEGEATDPGAPLRKQPGRHVPAKAAITAPTSESGTTPPETSTGGPSSTDTRGGHGPGPGSGTGDPGRDRTGDPRVAGPPTSAPTSPESTTPTPTPTPPTGSNGEGTPDPSTKPTATSEGSPDPTTTPSQGMGDGAGGTGGSSTTASTRTTG